MNGGHQTTEKVKIGDLCPECGEATVVMESLDSML